MNPPTTTSGPEAVAARPPGWGMIVAIVTMAAVGCTAVRPVPEQRERAYLELRVQPETAQIYVDGDYRGKVGGWVDGMMPLEPGVHRVKVAADGYMTRRFDVAIEAGNKRRLELEMEPKLDPGGSPEDAPSRRGEPRERRPGDLEEALDR